MNKSTIRISYRTGEPEIISGPTTEITNLVAAWVRLNQHSGERTFNPVHHTTTMGAFDLSQFRSLLPLDVP